MPLIKKIAKKAYKGAAKVIGTGAKGPGIGKVAKELYKKSPVYGLSKTIKTLKKTKKPSR